ACCRSWVSQCRRHDNDHPNAAEELDEGRNGTCPLRGWFSCLANQAHPNDADGGPTAVDENGSRCYELRPDLLLAAEDTRGGSNMEGVWASAWVAVSWSIAFLVGVDCPACAQSPVGQWTSEGGRAEIEIYSCGTAGHEVSNQTQLDTLCSYVRDSGSRLCGRV